MKQGRRTALPANTPNANGDRTSLPRDWFESVLDQHDEEVERLRAERDALAERIAASLEKHAEWVPCDCGCPGGQAPKDAVAVTWLRAAAHEGANVIAVALGDGGHRLAEVGPRVAAEEAIAAISRLRTAVETEGDA